MTKEEYIGMKNSNQYNLIFFYQYYVDNIDKATDKTLRSFEEFEQYFPHWHMHNVTGSDAMVERCKQHFDKKFGIVNTNQPT